MREVTLRGERFRLFKFTDSSEKPHQVVEYYVTGKGNFPVDMLRYDAAYPCDDTCMDLFVDFHDEPDRFLGNRSIRLRSHRIPTIDRWSSFGWSVGVNKL